MLNVVRRDNDRTAKERMQWRKALPINEVGSVRVSPFGIHEAQGAIDVDIVGLHRGVFQV